MPFLFICVVLFHPVFTPDQSFASDGIHASRCCFLWKKFEEMKPNERRPDAARLFPALFYEEKDYKYC